MLNMDEAIANLGARIQEARLLRNMTQEKLADQCNVSPKHISSIERGTSAGSITLLLSICNALNITPNALFVDSLIEKGNDDYSIIPLEKHNTIIKYCKLTNTNKEFIDLAIEHLSNEQARIK